MRLKRIRRFARRVLLIGAALLCLFAAGAIWFAFHCSPVLGQFQPEAPSERSHAVAEGIADYSRPEDSTFLTYPEWYIVWSYQERADFQAKQLPSGFPYFGAIKQYWSGYCCAYRITRKRYPFNFGDHVMLGVIGTSFSVEYAIRGSYERTIGRLTEWMASRQPVEEDLYSNRVAREYADFVHIRPFYEFSFARRLKGLWSQTRFWGPHPVRKLERRMFLSVDYGLQAFYCWLIERATHASYGIESADTYAWLENVRPEVLAANPRVRTVKTVGPDSYIAVLPRYQEFTTVASRLSASGVRFLEIAGNRQISLTVIVPTDWSYDLPVGEFLFSSGMLTAPESKRVVVRSPVAALHTVLNGLAARGVTVEHIYDY